MLKPKKHSNYLNSAAVAQEARITEQKRNRELYCDALEDVDFLRRCGWAINLTCDGRVQFGNQLLPLSVLGEKAERERRLRQPAPIGMTRVQAPSITTRALAESSDSIDEIVAHYTARTADQAEAALTLRLKFEANPGRQRNTAFPSRRLSRPKAA